MVVNNRFFKNFIEVLLIYNITLISSYNKVTQLYLYIFFFTFLLITVLLRLFSS